MAIYKVHIKTVGDKTTYTTNATTLAAITYRADFDKYDVNTPSVGVMVETSEEADKIARESVTAFLANLGVVPNFINE